MTDRNSDEFWFLFAVICLVLLTMFVTFVDDIAKHRPSQPEAMAEVDCSKDFDSVSCYLGF